MTVNQTAAPGIIAKKAAATTCPTVTKNCKVSAMFYISFGVVMCICFAHLQVFNMLCLWARGGRDQNNCTVSTARSM